MSEDNEEKLERLWEKFGEPRSRRLRGLRDESMCISVPWESDIRRRDKIQRTGEWVNNEITNINVDFVAERSKVHNTYIVETEKTKRTGYVISAFLLAMACLVPVFAPNGRENISYIVSISLFVFSAGAIGFTKVIIKNKDQKISASGNAK